MSLISGGMFPFGDVIPTRQEILNDDDNVGSCRSPRSSRGEERGRLVIDCNDYVPLRISPRAEAITPA